MRDLGEKPAVSGAGSAWAATGAPHLEQNTDLSSSCVPHRLQNNLALRHSSVTGSTFTTHPAGSGRSASSRAGSAPRRTICHR